MSTNDERRWSPILPFLGIAYPVTFLVFQGGEFCGPACFSPTLAGVTGVAIALVVVALLATGITASFRKAGVGHDTRPVRLLAAPSRGATVVLLGLFGAFLAFLALDSLGLYGALWRPVVLPLSFLLFAPVWLLYLTTFPLAVLFSVAGVEPTSVVTLATRAVVVGLGFPLSAAIQTYAVSVGWRRYGDD